MNKMKLREHHWQTDLGDLQGVDIWDDAEPEYPHPVCRVWFAGDAEHDPEKLIAHILSWNGE